MFYHFVKMGLLKTLKSNKHHLSNDDYKIEYKELVKNNYQIKITTKKGIFELLNFASLFATFHAIINDDNLHIREENVGKCIKSLNIIDAPYFVRYLFKLRFMFGENKFSNFKDELEKTDIPYIISKGRKGGSNLAAAIVNAILYSM